MMIRKVFPRFLVVAMALFVMHLTPALAKTDKPNVVLMLADNLGYGDVSSYNGGIRGRMRTPRIDQLAAEGMRLTQFLVERASIDSSVSNRGFSAASLAGQNQHHSH